MVSGWFCVAYAIMMFLAGMGIGVLLYDRHITKELGKIDLSQAQEVLKDIVQTEKGRHNHT